MDVMERISQLIKSQPVVIFMKGTPQFPQCGFSMKACQVLRACGAPYGHVNVFEDTEIYQNLKVFSNWPTFPQIFVGGELVGGCDIVVELYERGELQELIKKAVAASPVA